MQITRKRSFIVQLTAILALTAIYWFQPNSNFENRLLDRLSWGRYQTVAPLPGIRQITRIAFDDESFRRMDGASPWTQEAFSQLMTQLQKHHPATVVICSPFLGSEKDPIEEWFPSLISRYDNIVLASVLDYTGNIVGFPEEDDHTPRGLVYFPLDKDLVNRYFSPLIKTSAHPKGMVSLGTLAAYHYLGAKAADYVSQTSDSIEFRYPSSKDSAANNKILLKTNEDGLIFKSYRYRRGHYTHLSLWKFMAGEFDPSQIAGKIVLIGNHGKIHNNRYLTPLGSTSLLTVIANEIAMILDKDFVRFAMPDRRIEFVLLLLMAVALARFFLYTRHTAGLAALALLLPVMFWFSYYLFTAHNLLLEPFPYLAAITLSYALAYLHRGLWTFTENRALQHMVIMDKLTNLYSYAYLMLRINDEFKKFQRTGADFCFAMIDIDYFKKVNDLFGHQFGNDILVAVANLIKKAVRGYDVAARFGGEEFSLIILDADITRAKDTLERIRSTIEEYKFYTPKGEFHVTVSAGLCSASFQKVKAVDDLIKCADEALYRAKALGRNRVIARESENWPGYRLSA